MKPVLKVCVFIFIAVLVCSQQAYALKLYRCDGNIQYQPCEPAAPASSKDLLRTNRRPYARVVKSEFSGLPKQQGIWRGSVAGNGTVHLRLFIKKNGVVHSSRYMGNVALVDRSTTFAFKSVTPAGDDWSWNIVAYNS